MNTVLGTVLLLVLLSIFLWAYYKSKDIFSPICFFSLLQTIRYVPHMLSGRVYASIEGIQRYYYLVFFVEIILVFSVLFGYYSAPKKKHFHYEIAYSKTNDSGRLDKYVFWGGILAIIIGLSFTVFFFNRVGGLYRIILNPNDASYYEGTAYISSLRFLMVFGSLLLFSTKKKYATIIGSISVLIYCASHLVFTSRSPVFETVIILFVFYNYSQKRYKITSLFNPKFYVLYIFAIYIIIIMPLIRDSGGFVGGYSVGNSVGNLINSFFDQFSYAGRDAFVYSHFRMDNMWYGRTIVNLICAPLPSPFFPWKPPVDDGLYLYNFMNGYYILPPLNGFPLYNSVPFSTQGSMYANFGVIGVLLAGFFLGRLYAATYKITKETNGNPLMVVVYFSVIYQLELSSLSIVQTLIPIVLGYAYFKAVFGWRIVKYRNSSVER